MVAIEFEKWKDMTKDEEAEFDSLYHSIGGGGHLRVRIRPLSFISSNTSRRLHRPSSSSSNPSPRHLRSPETSLPPNSRILSLRSSHAGSARTKVCPDISPRLRESTNTREEDTDALNRSICIKVTSFQSDSMSSDGRIDLKHVCDFLVPLEQQSVKMKVSQPILHKRTASTFGLRLT
jgi:hypothetical protein